MAAQLNVCDECGVETTPANQVIIRIGSEFHAGAVLDFCMECSSGVLNDPVVVRAKRAFIERLGLPDDDREREPASAGPAGDR